MFSRAQLEFVTFLWSVVVQSYISTIEKKSNLKKVSYEMRQLSDILELDTYKSESWTSLARPPSGLGRLAVVEAVVGLSCYEE